VLVTTCTHCLARFRVTPQQLNEKQGQVRCGRCRKVFSGFEALERFPDDDTGTRLLAARDAQIGEVAGTLPEFDEPEPEAAPPPAEPARAESRPAPRMVEPPAPTPSRPLTPKPRPMLELEPPPAKPVSRAWAFAVALMLVVLSVEAAYGFRAQLARSYPITRPWLEAACARIGCTVPYPREDGLIKLEDSEMNEVPGRPNEVALGARIRNIAPFAQEYPYLELTLTDVGGQAAVRRVLRPSDYLGRPLGANEPLPAGADIAVQLRLETPRVRATGYELLLFYP
jgi:predicted Zn finger-like uncharacterized protein